jgi:hypothetical protein
VPVRDTPSARVFGGRYDDGTFSGRIMALAKPLPRLRSMRLFDLRPGGAQIACSTAFVYEEVAADTTGIDGAFTRLHRPTVHGLIIERETLTQGEAELTLALQGLSSSATYTVFGSRAACGQQHNQTDLEFLLSFNTDTAGERIMIETVEIAHEGLNSFRVVHGNGTGGALVACARARFMDYADDIAA